MGLASSFPQTIRMVAPKNLKGEAALHGRWPFVLPGRQYDAGKYVSLGKPDLGSDPSLPCASCVNWRTESNL